MTAADLLTRLLTIPDDGVPYVDWLVLPAGLAADLRAWRDGAPTPAPTTGAKGCEGCKFNDHGDCHIFAVRDDVHTWVLYSTGPDYCTPLPGAPECPGREEVERG
jgi:hypothetical protein